MIGEVSEIELRRAFTAFVHGGAAGTSSSAAGNTAAAALAAARSL